MNKITQEQLEVASSINILEFTADGLDIINQELSAVRHVDTQKILDIKELLVEATGRVNILSDKLYSEVVED